MSTTPFSFGTAERKVLIVLLYMVPVGVLAATGVTVFTRDAPRFEEELGKYFLCEAIPSPGQPCTGGYRKYSHPVVTIIAAVLVGLLPLVNLIFIIDTHLVKNLLQLLRRMVTKYQKPSFGANGT